MSCVYDHNEVDLRVVKIIETKHRDVNGIDAFVAQRPRKTWASLGRSDAPLGGWSKRSFDMSVALAMLIVFAPFMAVLGFLVYRSSTGPIFFRHPRVGYQNRLFSCLKFRTMVDNGGEVLEEYLNRRPSARLEWEETQKLRDDPRVTRLGRILRKLSLDELPQLYDVVRGDMSLVGPRPVPCEELRRYGRSSRFYLKARPGITGLWQVNGRNNTTYERRIAYDRAYITNFSAAGDLAILAQTLPAALRSDETS